MRKTRIMYWMVIGLALFACMPHPKENIPNDPKEETVALTSSLMALESIHHATGAYKEGDHVVISATLHSNAIRSMDVWIETILLNYRQDVIHQTIDKRSLEAKESIAYEAMVALGEGYPSGNYVSLIKVYNNELRTDNDLILTDQSVLPFQVFTVQEEFDTLDTSVWSVSQKKLGRTSFQRDNVFVGDGMLQLQLPKHSLEGGEIFTKALHRHGLYEIRMKLPLAPSSITGFFLYNSPDYQYEIDIEVFNDPTGSLLLTTYSKGGASNEYQGMTKFDPTADFHDYRIEYQKNYVAFHIDNQLVLEWTDGIPDGDMYLMLNGWYPKWLEGEQAKTDQWLQVEWIRY